MLRAMDLAEGSLLTAPRLPTPRLQRARGTGVLTCGRTGAATAPITLRQEGCARIRLLPSRAGVLEGLLVNTAGGLAGGDHLDWTIEVEGGARASISTTGCERVYRSTGEAALIDVRLRVSALASLETARSEAQRKQLYLERLVQPNLPDMAVEPRRIRSTFTVLALGLVLWGVLVGLFSCYCCRRYRPTPVAASKAEPVL